MMTISHYSNRLRVLSIACLAAAATLTAGAQTSRADRRLITESDILQFVWVADPQISADGSTIALVRVTVNEQKDDYETSIWLVPANGAETPRRLTSGTRDSSPRWSPDGKQLAFVRVVERDGRPQPPQVFLLALDGGEARAITDVVRGASSPVWSPDGLRIAFNSTTRPDDVPPAKDAKPDAKTDGPKSDVRVITSAVYRSNGGGWNDPERPSHLWVADAQPGPAIAKAHQLTSGEFSEGGAVWANDGSRLFFTSTRVADAYYQPGDTNLYAVPSTGGEITKVADIEGTIGNLKVSPDGKSIAFIGTLHGSPERSYSQSDLFVAAIGATPKNLTAKYDFDIGGGIGGDQAAPRGGATRSPIWSADGSSIVVVAGEQGDANLVRVEVGTGKVTPVYKGAHAVQSYTAAQNGSTIAALTSSPTNIGDVFVVSSGTPKQVTRVNDELFNKIKLSEPEEVWWTSFDGKKIEGWLLHPPRLRSHAEVSVHSSNSRRAALGLWQHVHARVPLDGGQGLRGPVSKSARQQQLRTGFWQHHSVPLSRRRLQGLDGRRG